MAAGMALEGLSLLAGYGSAGLGQARHSADRLPGCAITTQRQSRRKPPETIDDVDPALIETYNKLGIPLHEQEMLAGVQTRSVAVDVVFDSVSVATTFRDKLAEAGRDFHADF